MGGRSDALDRAERGASPAITGSRCHRPATNSMLYQMIVGAWPVDLDVIDAEGLREFAERLAGWQLKAMREAKLATDWTEPNLDYEDAARSFLYTIMSESSAFVAEAANLAHRIGPAGAINGLAQTLLKLTAPGIPDLYQGTEFWDQSLVDPDNRRPIDFALRFETLAAEEPLTSLAEIWRDGRVKQALIQRALGVRRAQPDLFARGSYQSLEVTGQLSSHIIAFARSLGDSHCIVVVPRLTARLLPGGDSIVVPHKIWSDTELHLPRALHGVRRDAVTDSPAPSGSSPWPLTSILREFPVAMLITD